MDKLSHKIFSRALAEVFEKRKLLLRIVIPLLAVPWCSINSQIVQNNVNVLGTLDLTYRGSEIGDVWGVTSQGNEFALVAILNGGVSIIDVSNPQTPTEVSWIPKPQGTDNLAHVKPYSKGYAYAVMRPGPVQIIDIRDPYNAQEVAQYQQNSTDVYGLFVHEDKELLILYGLSGAPSGVRLIILDISDPLNPIEVGTYFRNYHHVYTRGDRFYGYNFSDAIEIVDISDPTSPIEIKYFEEMWRTHSGWLNDSGTLMSVDHEQDHGYLTILDITTLPNDPVQVGQYQTSTNDVGNVSIHHSRWYDDLIYMSYWNDGFRVIDVSDPSSPVELAVYDITNPNTAYNHFDGCWGCYPYLPSRNVLTTQALVGLYVLDFTLDGPGIHHVEIDTAFNDQTYVTGNFSIINGDSINLNESFVYYRNGLQENWQSISISHVSDSEYEFNIPVSSENEKLDYYIQVKDINNRITRAPGMAPHNEYYEIAMVEPVSVEVKVILEGSYDASGDTMRTDLRDNDFIPTESPYPEDPGSTTQPIPLNITDWVLVQLRETDTGPAVASRSTFLRKDGWIVADDGTTEQITINISEGNYYIVIKHRNHLAVMSADPVQLSIGSSTLFDFTTSAGQYYGVDGAKEIETGIWGMWSGDPNQDREITTSDYTLWFNSARAGESGYSETDINLDIQVTTSDYTNWFNNTRAGASSAVP